MLLEYFMKLTGIPLQRNSIQLRLFLGIFRSGQNYFFKITCDWVPLNPDIGYCFTEYCFPDCFKFLRTAFFIEHLWWLLLIFLEKA